MARVSRARMRRISPIKLQSKGLLTPAAHRSCSAGPGCGGEKQGLRVSEEVAAISALELTQTNSIIKSGRFVRRVGIDRH